MTKPTREFSTRYSKTCATCASEFVSRSKNAMYCTTRCKGWAHRRPGAEPPPLREATRSCEQCGKSMTGRHRNARFCDNQCWYHFHNPAPDLAIPLICDVCKAQFMRKNQRGTTPKYCSTRCEQWRRRHPDQQWALNRKCQHCGISIDHMRADAVFCSPSHAAALHGHTRRAKVRSLPRDRINKYRVFERDRWRCHLCHKAIDKRLAHPHPMSPSLDHIIPLSDPDSPGHVWENVAASHLTCNLRKHTSSMGEQLILFGVA